MSIGSEGEESRISSTLHDRSEGGIGSSRNGNCFSEKKSSNKKKLIPGEKKRGNPADSPEFGELMLRRARELISGDNLKRALEHALRAVKSFEDYADGKRCLNLVMSLHVLAAIYNNLGQHEQAVAILKRSIQITGEKQEEGKDEFVRCSILWKRNTLFAIHCIIECFYHYSPLFHFADTRFCSILRNPFMLIPTFSQELFIIPFSSGKIITSWRYFYS